MRRIMQSDYSFPKINIETSRNFLDHINKKDFSNKSLLKLERLKIEIFIHKEVLKFSEDTKDVEYIQ